MTAQVWIDSTRDMLLSGYVEELDLVTTAPSPATTGTTLVVQGIASSIVKGVVIEVNAELMYVISITTPDQLQPPTLLATLFVSPPSFQLIALFLLSTTTSLICLPQVRGCFK